MDPFDWHTFLAQLSAEALRDPEIVDYEHLPDEVLASGWLGYPGATDEEIARAEARLEITLPPSYRALLKVSNGWRHVPPFITRVWSTDEIEWFAVRHQGWIDSWLSTGDRPVSDGDYFIYGPGQSAVVFRKQYLQTALEISDYGDACIWLLNPQVVNDDGEWEAMFLAGWLPGVQRYRSFQEMMQGAFEDYLRILEDRRMEEGEEDEEDED